jgi:protein gp37
MEDDESIRLWRLSKKDAGRILEGRTWDEIPVSVA